jgi:hypothetical protein
LGRILIPVAIVVAILAVFAFILLVSRLGTDDDGEVDDNGMGSAVLIVSDAGDRPR